VKGLVLKDGRGRRGNKDVEGGGEEDGEIRRERFTRHPK
jgi:hypothetical protein